jgi:hypothetical protein
MSAAYRRVPATRRPIFSQRPWIFGWYGRMGEEDSRSQSQTRLEMFNANTAGMVTRRLNLAKPALI